MLKEIHKTDKSYNKELEMKVKIDLTKDYRN